QELPDLADALRELHFPSDEKLVISARERLAAEELVGLIRQAKKSKALWAKRHDAPAIKESKPVIPPSIPFTLTHSQQQAVGEILADIARAQPMNRLLTGDVGSGKTVVAGIAARQVVEQGLSACLVAPTKVLAQQHAQTLQRLFPEVPITLVTGSKQKNLTFDTARFFVGTHAVFSLLADIQPALLIYDEQHRFGVKQRLAEGKLVTHRLTMTATPIPRSLSLSLFAHLDHSQITELPLDRIPTKTWILPEKKRADMYNWIETQVKENPQYLAILVCPFIEQSTEPGMTEIAAATKRFAEVKKRFGKTCAVGLLHGRQSPAEQQEVLAQLFAQKINVLVSTSIIEVGIDLPQASALVIESAEQYGLASLHQLRGRVGRAGQQGYCYLFTSSDEQANTKRLRQLLTTTDGHKLAEFDLENRGAGNLFSTTQHGFSFLRFASWTNLTLLQQARTLEEKLPKEWKSSLFLDQKSLLATAN
ncbi:MAG: helicase-related protein, partial [bacterium]|nr:helicase-related protein [bacterium]